MQLLLLSLCVSSSFHGVNVIFIIALYQLQKLKACELIKMMYSNLVEETFLVTLWLLGNLVRETHSVKLGSLVCTVTVHRFLFLFDCHGI